MRRPCRCLQHRNRTASAVMAALLVALSPCVFGQTVSGDPPAAETLWLGANGSRLKTSIYHSSQLSNHPVLVVLLHGDLMGLRTVPPFTYTYIFANDATRKIDDLVVAAVLRPGYRDHTGERSDGNAGLATGDNYTPEVVEAVVTVIAQLKGRFHPAHTVLVGHSGGAAITGDLLGVSPSAVDGALLMSCPCDLDAWRKYMMRQQHNNAIWSMAIHSLSPLQLASKVSAGVQVALLVGSQDDVAPPWMSKRYVETLKSGGNYATLIIAPGLGHEILLEPVAYEALQRLLESVRRNGTDH